MSRLTRPPTKAALAYDELQEINDTLKQANAHLLRRELDEDNDVNQSEDDEYSERE